MCDDRSTHAKQLVLSEATIQQLAQPVFVPTTGAACIRAEPGTTYSGKQWHIIQWSSQHSGQSITNIVCLFPDREPRPILLLVYGLICVANYIFVTDRDVPLKISYIIAYL